MSSGPAEPSAASEMAKLGISVVEHVTPMGPEVWVRLFNGFYNNAFHQNWGSAYATLLHLVASVQRRGSAVDDMRDRLACVAEGHTNHPTLDSVFVYPLSAHETITELVREADQCMRARDILAIIRALPADTITLKAEITNALYYPQDLMVGTSKLDPETADSLRGARVRMCQRVVSHWGKFKIEAPAMITQICRERARLGVMDGGYATAVSPGLPPDSDGYVPARVLRTLRPEFERADQLTKYLDRLPDKPSPAGIRRRRKGQRLFIHAADWHNYFATQDRRADEAADGKSVQALIDGIEERKALARSLKESQGK